MQQVLEIREIKPNLHSTLNRLYVRNTLNQDKYDEIVNQLAIALGPEWFLDTEPLSEEGHICLFNDEEGDRYGQAICLYLQPQVDALSKVRLQVKCDWKLLPKGAIELVPKDELNREFFFYPTQLNKGIDFLVEEIKNQIVAPYQLVWEETIHTHKQIKADKKISALTSTLSRILGTEDDTIASATLTPIDGVEVGVEAVVTSQKTVDVVITNLPTPAAKVLMFFLKNNELYA